MKLIWFFALALFALWKLLTSAGYRQWMLERLCHQLGLALDAADDGAVVMRGDVSSIPVVLTCNFTGNYGLPLLDIALPASLPHRFTLHPRHATQSFQDMIELQDMQAAPQVEIGERFRLEPANDATHELLRQRKVDDLVRKLTRYGEMTLKVTPDSIRYVRTVYRPTIAADQVRWITILLKQLCSALGGQVTDVEATIQRRVEATTVATAAAPGSAARTDKATMSKAVRGKQSATIKPSAVSKQPEATDLPAVASPQSQHNTQLPPNAILEPQAQPPLAQTAVFFDAALPGSADLNTLLDELAEGQWQPASAARWVVQHDASAQLVDSLQDFHLRASAKTLLLFMGPAAAEAIVAQLDDVRVMFPLRDLLTQLSTPTHSALARLAMQQSLSEQTQATLLRALAGLPFEGDVLLFEYFSGDPRSQIASLGQQALRKTTAADQNNTAQQGSDAAS